MKKTNVNTTLAIFFTAIMLIIGLGTTTTTGPITLQKAFALLQGSDRCVSNQALDGDSTSSTCITASDRKTVNEGIKSEMDTCKDAKEQGEVDKCSGSQTAFGEFCNWVRVKGDEFAVVFDPDASCSEVRHTQKDLLQ